MKTAKNVLFLQYRSRSRSKINQLRNAAYRFFYKYLREYGSCEFITDKNQANLKKTRNIYG